MRKHTGGNRLHLWQQHAFILVTKICVWFLFNKTCWGITFCKQMITTSLICCSPHSKHRWPLAWVRAWVTCVWTPAHATDGKSYLIDAIAHADRAGLEHGAAHKWHAAASRCWKVLRSSGLTASSTRCEGRTRQQLRVRAQPSTTAQAPAGECWEL